MLASGLVKEMSDFHHQYNKQQLDKGLCVKLLSYSFDLKVVLVIWFQASYSLKLNISERYSAPI